MLFARWALASSVQHVDDAVDHFRPRVPAGFHDRFDRQLQLKVGQVYAERENTSWSGSTPTSWTDRWLHYDMLGNVVLRTDSTGAVTDR